MNRPKCVKRTDFGAMLIELAEHAIRGIPPKEYYWLDETNFVRKIIHCDMIHQRFTIDNFYEISFARALAEERIVELEE